MRAPPCPAVQNLRRALAGLPSLNAAHFERWRETHAIALCKEFALVADLPLSHLDEWILEQYLQVVLGVTL
jgi:hypothetical protein